MTFLLTLKKSYIYPTFLVAVTCFLFLLASIPIKWTPIVAIFPEYNTWHQVSSVHLMKVLWRALPTGVVPIENCSYITESDVLREHIDQSKIKVFPYSATKDAISSLEKQNSNEDFSVFLPILDRKNKVTLLHTYKVMEEALRKVGVSHVLLHGTLLGVYRFGGISPWDDDLDVAINVSRWKDVRKALSCINGFELFVDSTMRWSFFSSGAPRSNSMVDKKYPFIDIFFQAEDETHVWGLHWLNRRSSLYPKKDIFPPIWDYMEGIKVPVPNKALQVLQSQYGNLSLCTSQEHGHLLPPQPVKTIPCSLLYPVYGNFSSPH